MTRKMDENYAIASERRLISNLTLQAEQRYVYLRKTYPEFLRRFPLYQIASYLGITKETLSRIRQYDARK
jgi:CRP-like cAMP-binding protein